MNNQSSKMLNVINIADYKKGKRISKSGFGALYNAEEKKTGNIYDAKIIDCDDDEEKLNKMMTQNVESIMSLKHQTIINIIGYSKLDFSDENNIVVIMNHAKNGSLADLIKLFQEKNDLSQYSNTNRQIIIAGIARGMKLLHDRNIIHLDLKSSNILLDENYKPIITDFYLTNLIEIKKSFGDQFSGNLPYLAPEILNSTSHDKKADVYAFGILMYEIITNSFAYPELRNGSLSNLQFQNKVITENFRPTFTKKINGSLQQLIEKCLSSDPKDRPDFDEIFNKIAFCNNNETNSKSNKYFLDDVDVEKYTQYINEIADPQEQLLSKMSIIEEENKQLKNDIILLKKEKEEYLAKISEIEKDKELLKKDINNMKNQNEENLKRLNSCCTLLREEDQEHLKILNSYVDKYWFLKRDYSEMGVFVDEIIISTFNNYNLELQQKLMERFSKYSKIDYKGREYYRKINSFLVYLQEFYEIRKYCIKIICYNDEKKLIDIKDEYPVQLNTRVTNIIFQSKYFSFNKFALYSNMFEEFRIELDYSQSSFDEIYNNALKIKNSNSTKFIISIIYNSSGEFTDLHFRNNKNISYLSIIGYFTEIKSENLNGSFENCTSLVQVKLPDSLTSIGCYSFASCSSLKEISLPSGLEKMDPYCFKNCQQLTTISIPFKVQTIPDGCFQNCTNLVNVSIHPYLTNIMPKAFYQCFSLTEITIPSSIQSIGNNAFYECKKLKKIVIPSSIKEISDHVFYACSSLKEVSISSSAKTINDYAFKGCSSLAHITIPSSVYSIKEGAFEDCSSLTDITFEDPSSLTEIGKCVFKNCKSLKKISLPSSLTQIGENVFDGCSSLKIILILSDINTNEIGLQSNVKIVNNPDDFILNESNPFSSLKF